MLNLCVFLCAFVYLTTSGAFANILLIGNNTSLSFNAVPAKFGRPVTGSGEHGTIFLASPLDACSPLMNTLTNKTSGYLLIVRGDGCDFVDKVRYTYSRRICYPINRLTTSKIRRWGWWWMKRTQIGRLMLK